jgi:hypothetical protein
MFTSSTVSDRILLTVMNDKEIRIRKEADVACFLGNLCFRDSVREQ